MKKIAGRLTIITLVTMFVGCGVFFAAKEGRWNALDPDNELSTFNPSIDGYVESGVGWIGDKPTLYALPSSKLILIRFDTGDFPDSVAASYLKLKVNTQPPNDADLAIHRIIQSWDATISYSLADDPVAFYNGSSVATAKIPASIPVGEEVLIPLTGIYSGDKEKLGNGLIVSSSVTLQFDSSESGMGPLLLIEPD